MGHYSVTPNSTRRASGLLMSGHTQVTKSEKKLYDNSGTRLIIEVPSIKQNFKRKENENKKIRYAFEWFLHKLQPTNLIGILIIKQLKASYTDVSELSP